MMKQLFQENRNAFLLLLGLLFVLLLAVYFFFYRPLTSDLEQTEVREVTLTDEIAILEARLDQFSVDEAEDMDELERIRLEPQIPRTAELDEFLITLNEIELVSNSRIDSMSFGYQGDLPQRFEPEPEESEEETNQIEELEVDLEQEDETDVEEAETEAEETTTFAMEELPSGLEPIVVSLNVQSPDYENFQIFLQEIEKQERIMIVPSLSFVKPAENELIFTENPDESISVTVEVMTFYYEG